MLVYLARSTSQWHGWTVAVGRKPRASANRVVPFTKILGLVHLRRHTYCKVVGRYLEPHKIIRHFSRFPNPNTVQLHLARPRNRQPPTTSFVYPLEIVVTMVRLTLITQAFDVILIAN